MDESSCIEFFRHNVGEAERQAVDQALRGLFLTSGATVRSLESALASYVGGDVGALGVSSCTAALHLAMVTCGIGAGDEVITTPMTFTASANAILHAGATPVFVDVDARTGLIDPGLVEAAITQRTRAVLAVHLYGQMADVKSLAEICRRHDLRLFEDAAHALEAQRDGLGVGHLGDAACLSFYATKNITSGEGGALLMRDSELLAKARRLSLHGMTKSAADRHGGAYQHWDQSELGFKCNMTNIAAAMLLPQLERIESLLARREALACRYEEAFGQVPGLGFPEVAPSRRSAGRSAAGRSARHLFALWPQSNCRDEFLQALGELGIGTAVNYRPVHLLTYYRESFGYELGDFKVAEWIGARTFSLPLYPLLTDDQQTRVIEAVLQVHQGLS